jgi:hypothetical protein
MMFSLEALAADVHTSVSTKDDSQTVKIDDLLAMPSAAGLNVGKFVPLIDPTAVPAPPPAVDVQFEAAKPADVRRAEPAATSDATGVMSNVTAATAPKADGLRSKLMWLGAGMSLAAGIAAGIMLMAPKESAEAHQSVAAVAAVSDATPSVPAPSIPTTTTPTPSDPTSAGTEAPAAEAKPTVEQPTAPASAAPAATPSVNSTAQSSARRAVTGAEVQKPQRPKPAAADTGASFDRNAAKNALTSAAAQASSCKQPDGPLGGGKVQVTFAPSGRVTTANIVGGRFGGTAVGGCIARTFRSARVPKFVGEPVTVAKSFSIN